MFRTKCEIVHLTKWTTKTEISLNREILKFKTNWKLCYTVGDKIQTILTFFWQD